MLIDIQAIRQAAKNKAAATGYTDNVDNVAAKNYPNYPRYPHYPVIHGVEVALTSPRHSPLLALADNYCSAIQASDKARNDWCTDIEATPSPAKPLPKFSVHQPWNVADRAYQAHHWSCPTCKATARSGGHSQRCAEGQDLYDLYEQAFEAGKNRHD